MSKDETGLGFRNRSLIQSGTFYDGPFPAEHLPPNHSLNRDPGLMKVAQNRCLCSWTGTKYKDVRVDEINGIIPKILSFGRKRRRQDFISVVKDGHTLWAIDTAVAQNQSGVEAAHDRQAF